MLKGSVQVFDEKFRIPLILTGYGIDAHSIISQQVRSVDIFPTLLEILGYDTDLPIHGTSLLPIIKKENMVENPAYLESHKNVVEGINYNIIGIRTSNFKYFRDKNDPNKDVNLYDLTNDPYEEHNIANNNKQLISEMESIIKRIQTSINNV